MKTSKRTENKKRNGCYKYFETFTNNTNLHGFRYITDHNISIFERLIWTTMICVSIIICIYLMIAAWIQWNSSRVIVTFDRTAAHVWQIPFPAVTICPETRIRQSLYNSSKIVAEMKDKHLSKENFLIMESIAQVCDTVTFPNLGSSFVNDSLTEFLKNISLPFEDQFYSCEWGGKTMNCDDIFTPILTDRGFCFSFNILAADIYAKNTVTNNFDKNEKSEHSRGWTLESGYPKYLPPDTYPRRGTTPGLEGGLSILLGNKKSDVDYLCSGTFHGFRVSLQSPTNIPTMSQQYFMLPFNDQLIVSIKPSMVFTPIELQSLSPSKRGCFMVHERKLKFFDIYSSTNCASECLSNYTLAVCGCVGFYMPRDTSMRICGSGKMDCMKEAQTIMEERETLYALKELPPHIESFPEYCNCISECTSISYEQSVSQTKLDTKETIEAFDLDKNPKDVFVATIRMYFRTAHFIPSERVESSGVAQFLGNIGGVVNLFMGFSLLTFVEVAYYMLIKPTLFAIKKRSNEKSSDRNNDEST